MQLQILSAGRAPVDAGLLWHVADGAPDRAAFPDRVVPRDRRDSGVRLGQRDQDADSRRLAGAVRAEQPEDLAFGNGERRAVERLHVAVPLP